MLPTKRSLPSIYNPSNQSADELISNFVIRLKEFEELFSVITLENRKTALQHFIIQGQRGYGKTTLLWRLYYEITNEPELNAWLIPIIFDEEQYYIHSLSNLWEEIAGQLESENASFCGLKDGITKILDSESDEEKAFETIINVTKKNNRRILVLWDNFGQAFAKFSRKDRQRLREVLITCNHLRIIGASTVVMEYNFDYSQPFYEFFKIISLDELDTQETISLLKNLGQSYKADEINKVIQNQPGRIEALRRLTGGVPRTIVLLFEIFVDDVDGHSFKDLEMLLDKVTPLYKQRMDDLPTQQQAIVDAIAMNWDAISVKELSARTRMPGKAISAQLNLLEKNQLIKKIPTTTKNHLYQLNERFFNIWYLMRHGRRKKRNQVRWLVEFLESWCCVDELIKRTKQHIEAMKQGTLYERHAYYLSQALAKTPIPAGLQDSLIKETRDYLQNKNSSLVMELDKSFYEASEDILDDLKNNDEQSAIRKLQNQNYAIGKIYYTIGRVFHVNLSQYDKAKYYYEIAVEQGDSQAMFNLANLFATEFKDFAKAEQYYLKAIEQGVSMALNNLAILYRIYIKDFVKAEQYYLKAIEQGDSRALNNLATLYQTEFKDFAKAEKYYLMAIEEGDPQAMNDLAWQYFEQRINKLNALELARNSFDKLKNIYSAPTYSMILLWNDEIEKALEIAREFISDVNAHEKFPMDIQMFLLMLLAKKQYHYVYNLFTENKCEIKDRYKPIYYALMYFMQDKYPNVFKKMGSELKETVMEIVEKIKQMESDYA